MIRTAAGCVVGIVILAARLAGAEISFDEGGRVTVRLRDASARGALQAIGAGSGIEVILPDGWDRRVTVQWESILPRRALERLAGNWAFLESADPSAGGRLIVLPGGDRAGGSRARELYLRAIDLYEPPTPDEARLIRRILRSGWTEEGRALRRIFELNAEALSLFSQAVNAGDTRFPWRETVPAELVDSLRPLLRLHLAESMARIARGESISALPAMASAVKVAHDVGREGPVRARMAENVLWKEVLGGLDVAVPGVRGDSGALRAAVRTLEILDSRADPLGPALADQWPGLVAFPPEGGPDVLGADAEELARMPFLEADRWIRTTLDSDELGASDRRALRDLRKVLLGRAETVRMAIGLRLRMAARAYEADRGRPPADVAALRPEYLAEEPVDPITGLVIRNPVLPLGPGRGRPARAGAPGEEGDVPSDVFPAVAPPSSE